MIMSIEIHYQVCGDSSSDVNVLFESVVWLPNHKVPLRVVHKVIERQIWALVENEPDSSWKDALKDDKNICLYFNETQASFL